QEVLSKPAIENLGRSTWQACFACRRRRDAPSSRLLSPARFPPLPSPSTPARPPAHADIVYPSAIPFLMIHLGCFAAIWSGVSVRALVLCGVLYGLRM